jgi:hypothetical protein
LALFKGELSYEDIMWGMPKKALLDLRDARVKRLSEEQKTLEEQQREVQRQAFRDQVMKP